MPGMCAPWQGVTGTPGVDPRRPRTVQHLCRMVEVSVRLPPDHSIGSLPTPSSMVMAHVVRGEGVTVSLVDDEVEADLDVGGLTADDLLARCRAVELRRRADEGRLLLALIEIERRKLYTADGFRDLAAYGRGVHRWEATEARSRRGLVKLARQDGRIVDRLIEGRIGVAQAHLLGRLFEAPRVGQLLVLFLDMFLDWAAMLDFADFDEHVRNWRLLVDQDGSDPERAHRERSLSIGMSDHTYQVRLNGPAIDGVALKALLARFEQIEWDLDWEATVAVHGDEARLDLMPRTATQRRYDAFQHLLAQVQVPGSDGAPTAVDTVVNIVADVDTYVAALDRVFGEGHGRRPFPVPFGPTAGRCETTDGDAVSPRDMVLASLAGRIRVVLTGEGGKVVAMTSRQRFFRGARRDAVLLQATRCTHAGCLVAGSKCTVDHEIPSSHDGPTSVANGGGACDHHNIWRYTARATIRRHADGRITTHRADGTDIAPPD